MSESVPSTSAVPVLESPLAESARAANTDDATAQFAKYKTAFADLFTWKQPYLSGSAFAGTLTALYLLKYVNVLKLFFNAAYIALGTAIAVEFAGRTIKGGPGFVSSFRGSGKYFVVSKDVVDPLFSELTVLTNFVLVEVQQIVFVESFPVTVAAFFFSYFTYYLVNYVSLWCLAQTATVVAFTAPIVYRKYQKQIDEQVAKACKIAEEQKEVAKAKANEHFGKAASVAKGYVDLGLDKVGYKRNMPPVPAAAAAVPEKTAPTVVAEPAAPAAPAL